LIFFEGDQRPFLGLYPGILTGNDAKAVHQIDVRAKIGHAVGDVKIQACYDAHNRYQGGYRKDHAQEGQEAAQLMGAQSVQRQAKRLHDGNCCSRDPASAPANGDRCGGHSRQSISRGYAQNMASGCYLIRGRTVNRSYSPNY
jgi:hypothetical protein